MILLFEDQWFRRRTGYVLEIWDKPKSLPLGLAAVVSLLAGYLAGGVPGMAQTWYIGPIAARIGKYGGDVGIHMSCIITVFCYFSLRYLENRVSGR